jgi:hypothetical protein
MGSELPVQVRQQLAGMGLYFTLRLETCRDAAKLTGRWGSQHVTYGSVDFAVKKVHDPYDLPIELAAKSTAKDYQIVRLDISYEGRKQKQSELQARVDLARYDLDQAKDEARRRNTEYEERVTTARQRHEAFVAAETRYADAVQQLNGYVPADGVKSDAYRKLEQKRDRLQRRVNMLYSSMLN